MSNIKLPSDSLKLSPELRPVTAFARVIFRPSRGRKPWFASVFIMGHGLQYQQVEIRSGTCFNKRTLGLLDVSLLHCHYKGKRTVTVAWRHPLSLAMVRVGRGQSRNHQIQGKDFHFGECENVLDMFKLEVEIVWLLSSLEIPGTLIRPKPLQAKTALTKLLRQILI